jgi:lactate dehydrogenase-like 2-hydroxyacid dehydrogenase
LRAGFDALREEPPRQGNPLLELNLPNFIITPHIAWASKEAMQALRIKSSTTLKRLSEANRAIW